MADEYILTLSCPDKMGIVAGVSNFLANNNCNILDSAQFGDSHTGLFFMRVHFAAGQNAPVEDALRREFSVLGDTFGMAWKLVDAKARCRMAVLVSKFGHCLNDLVYRCTTGTLSADIACIISNHEDLREVAGWHNIPFYYLPVTKENRGDQETAILETLEKEKADLVVLARYMQILSDGLCRLLEGRCINIHHSFLPSFKGAQPYHQAHARGVKIIGATAHYVTANLDEGPIIEQEVERVNHACTPEDLTAIGRDVESLVLSRAIRYHVEHRVMINGNKTVVMR